MKQAYFILLIVGLLLSFGCGQQGGTLPPARETGVIYQCKCFWTEEEFSNITEANLEELFNQTYNVDAGHFNFTFDETNHSTITECLVYDKISSNGDEYVAYFSWFLDPLTLDFINDNFKESETGLSWEGNINGVQTTIIIECPPQDSVYALGPYGVGVGHCHAHIWWPASSGSLVKCIEIMGKER